MRNLLHLITLFLFTIVSAGWSQTNQLLGPAEGVRVIREISPDGRYVVGQTSYGAQGYTGYVWDSRAGNTITALAGGGEAYSVTNARMVVGIFDDPLYYVGGSIIRSGGYSASGTIWSSLGLGLIKTPNSVSDGTAARRISSDGKTIVGYSKKASFNPVVVAYAWTKNEQGEWKGEEWAHPEDVRQSCPIDVSFDGQIAVGFVQDAQRAGIIWRSKTSYELPFGSEVSEYLCLSNNGKYAGFNLLGAPGIHNLETNEKTMMSKGFLINDISNDGLAVGGYRTVDGDIRYEKAFVYSEKLGFLDFYEFLLTFAPDIQLPESLEEAMKPNNIGRYSVNAITPDGLSFAIVSATSAYILKLGAPIEVYPYPVSLSANVPVVDRNKVILTWEAPQLSLPGSVITGYAVYRNNESIVNLSPGILTFTDENVPAGYQSYSVKAMYGNELSRPSEAVRVAIVDTYDLPLFENFLPNSFVSNYWTTSISHQSSLMEWSTVENIGAGSFTGGLIFSANNFTGIPNKEYEASLVSKYLNGRDAENVYLSYVIRTYNYEDEDFTPDTLFVEVYDGASTWTTLSKTTLRPNMNWNAQIMDISSAAKGHLFKVRFRISGVNVSISAKYVYFDNVTVASGLPSGEFIPQNILWKKEGEASLLVWQQSAASPLYGLTYANSSKMYSIGNAGKGLIAVNTFNPEDLTLYKGMYLSSVSVYINQLVSSPSVETKLKLVVFEDNRRIIDDIVTGFTSNAWNTFPLDEPVLIGNKRLRFGLEVINSDPSEQPIGVDGKGIAQTGKGDTFSENGGTTWKTLTEEGKAHNWCIVGNVSKNESYSGTRDLNIVGYNIYKNGIKVNDDLIFGQSYVIDDPAEYYTIRAYSAELGISAESAKVRPTGINRPVVNKVTVRPDFQRQVLLIDSEIPVENISICDISGRLAGYVNAPGTSVSVSNLANGVYVVKIATREGNYTCKICKD